MINTACVEIKHQVWVFHIEDQIEVEEEIWYQVENEMWDQVDDLYPYYIWADQLWWRVLYSSVIGLHLSLPIWE